MGWDLLTPSVNELVWKPARRTRRERVEVEKVVNFGLSMLKFTLSLRHTKADQRNLKQE